MGRAPEVKVVVTQVCPLCDEISEVMVEESGLEEWLNGALIQDALPDLTPGQRETLLSGCHEGCFDAAFREE